MSALTLLVTTLVFLVLWWRKVFDGRATSWALLSTVPFAASGCFVAYWLIEPPLNGVVEPALEALHQGGIFALVPYLIPLVLQLLGALASFLLLFASIALCTSSVAAALIEFNAMALWLWKFVFWCGRFTSRRGAFVWFCVLFVLAVIASSGLMAEWMFAISRSLPTLAPAT